MCLYWSHNAFVVITVLIFTISNTNAYANELCSSNWMAFEGNFTFDESSCSVTSGIESSTAVLVDTIWPFLTFAQNSSYTLEIEYNFTIINTTTSNNKRSVGVIWYPDAGEYAYDYIGVSFNANEAFAASTHALGNAFVYRNIYSPQSNENTVIINGSFIIPDINLGALPFTLSLNTSYSMHVSIYRIVNGGVSHDVYINNDLILSGTSTALGAYTKNISWIGLKSTETSVLSHSLTVYQKSVPNDGISLIEQFQSWVIVPITTSIQTSYVSSTDLSITSSIAVTDEAVITSIDDVAVINNDTFPINTAVLIISVMIFICLCCGCVLMVKLGIMTNKKRKITINMVGMHEKTQHVQKEGQLQPGIGIKQLPAVPPSVDTNRIITAAQYKQSLSQSIESHREEGVKRVATTLNTMHGKESDDKSALEETQIVTGGRTAHDERRCCIDCGLIKLIKEGHFYAENECFYCNECWQNYVQNEDMYGYGLPVKEIRTATAAGINCNTRKAMLDANDSSDSEIYLEASQVQQLTPKTHTMSEITDMQSNVAMSIITLVNIDENRDNNKTANNEAMSTSENSGSDDMYVKGNEPEQSPMGPAHMTLAEVPQRKHKMSMDIATDVSVH